MYSPSRSPLPPPSLSHPSGSSQCTRPEHLSHAPNLGWWSVSPLIIYLFRCCSLETSHPRLLSQSPKVCSVHLPSTTVWRHQFFSTQPFYRAVLTLAHDYWKTTASTVWAFVGKVMSPLFNTLSRFVIAFLPRSKSLLISWLQSPSTVILKPKKIKSVSFHCFPNYSPWSEGTGCRDLSFLKVVLTFWALVYLFRKWYLPQRILAKIKWD